MRSSLIKLIGPCVLIAWMLLGNLFPVAGAQAETIVQRLSSAGAVGPNAIQLSVRTNRPKEATFREGEFIAFHVKTSRKAYIAAIYISSVGDAIVLYPNSETPAGLMLPGKEYTLFGSDSRLKLKVSKKIKEGKIFFFAFSKPLDFHPLKIAEGRICLWVPRSSAKEQDILTKKVEQAAQWEGFNRKVVTVKGAGETGVSLRMMGLPDAEESEDPGTTTGAQGLRDNIKKPDKQ